MGILDLECMVDMTSLVLLDSVASSSSWHSVNLLIIFKTAGRMGKAVLGAVDLVDLPVISRETLGLQESRTDGNILGDESTCEASTIGFAAKHGGIVQFTRARRRSPFRGKERVVLFLDAITNSAKHRFSRIPPIERVFASRVYSWIIIELSDNGHLYHGDI